jgi:hypothetical protein
MIRFTSQGTLPAGIGKLNPCGYITEPARADGDRLRPARGPEQPLWAHGSIQKRWQHSKRCALPQREHPDFVSS